MSGIGLLFGAANKTSIERKADTGDDTAATIRDQAGADGAGLGGDDMASASARQLLSTHASIKH
jgi:hypothetical protein